MLPWWASTVQPEEDIPTVVVFVTVVVGVAGLVGAAGLWMLRKWGVWLTVIVSVVSVLDAAPGIAFAPTAAWQVAATVTVMLFVLIIVLVMLPTWRRSFTASCVSEKRSH